MSNKLKLPAITKEKFRSSTLNFLFIIAYVNLFQLVLGPENSIVGVIFTIMMSASMVRDLTANPIRHLFIQSFVLVFMALAAFWVHVLPAPLSFLVNFTTLLVILYAFTYEYSSHMYFPYILSYLFLVFISPANESQLPRRILAMIVGALSMILYQWFMGRNRVVETARDVLSEMIDDLNLYISYKLKEHASCPDPSDTRKKLCLLSQTVYDRRKKIFCVSDAGFSMIAAGRGLEHLLLLISELPENLSAQDRALLIRIEEELKSFRSFIQQQSSEIPALERSGLFAPEQEKSTGLFYRTLLYTRDRLLHMTDPQNKRHYRKTALSLKVQLQAALDLSPVRAVYALRTALLLSCATLLVQLLKLPHGKWLLFTLASVSLPYADDVPSKIKKRTFATILGGLLSVAIYSLIPSPAGRTAVMMLSGYISFYFSDYAQTFTCSTVGALGGAVFMNALDFPSVSAIFLIRLGYILAGALAGYALNCLIYPYSRARATKQLWNKYKNVTELLTKVSHWNQADPQLYYNLVIQAHLQEEKLIQNARLEEWTQFPELLSKCREQVRNAHRTLIAGRADAPAFEAGHLRS